MTKAELPAGGLNTMSYYGDGKRRQYQDSATGRIFLWDGNNILRQTDEGGTTNRRYTIKPAGLPAGRVAGCGERGPAEGVHQQEPAGAG